MNRNNGNFSFSFSRAQLLLVLFPLVLIFFVSCRPREAQWEYLGNPHAQRYPDSQAFARSIWDMAVFRNSVYVGGGDARSNRGPVDLWAFDPASSIWKKDYTARTEEVNNFRIQRGVFLLEAWDPLGYLKGAGFYRMRNGRWEEVWTLPRSLHVTDIFRWRRYLFAATALFQGRDSRGYAIAEAVVMKSRDGGRNWAEVKNVKEDELPYIIGGFFFEFGSRLFYQYHAAYYRYNRREDRFERIEYLDKYGLRFSRRSAAFQEGIVFIEEAPYVRNSRGTGYSDRLVYLAGIETGTEPKIIEYFRERGLRPTDVMVQGNSLYVLAYRKKDALYAGCLYRTGDKDSWEEVLCHDWPAAPWSMEYLNGYLYIGLAQDPAEGIETAGPECGNVYRLSLAL